MSEQKAATKQHYDETKEKFQLSQNHSAHVFPRHRKVRWEPSECLCFLLRPAMPIDARVPRSVGESVDTPAKRAG